MLGYLVAGVLIGPHTLHIIRHVHGTKAIAEFGVVFLLFNIGLEVGIYFKPSSYCQFRSTVVNMVACRFVITESLN